MGKKKNLSEGCTKEELDFIDEKMMRRLSGNELNNSLKALSYKLDIKCKNKKQKEFLKLIKEKEITFCSGECGTGKSWIALSAALALLKEDNHYKKILIIVPTVEAGNMSIGFLKGSKEEKIQPYLEPDYYTITKILKDSGNLGSELMLKHLLNEGLLEGDGIQFIRGKTFDDSIVLISECENLSKQEMFLILSRIGNSKYIFTGDVKQLDRKDIIKNGNTCGLEYAMEKLQGMNNIGVINFEKEDIVRNPIIGKIMDRWFEEEV